MLLKLSRGSCHCRLVAPLLLSQLCLQPGDKRAVARAELLLLLPLLLASCGCWWPRPEKTGAPGIRSLDPGIVRFRDAQGNFHGLQAQG